MPIEIRARTSGLAASFALAALAVLGTGRGVGVGVGLEPSHAAAATTGAATAATATSAVGKFGAPLSATKAMDCKSVLANATKYDDKDVKLTGKVSGVCQAKGCWMTLTTSEPGAPSVRIKFKDYAFFVPKDSMGKTATVEGRFKVKTLSVAEAQHYADDAAKAGAPAKKITEPQHEYSLMASGVEIAG